MMTLRLFAKRPETVPANVAWLLAGLGEARGKQELFTRQAPQKLKVLREHALIESAVSSNRIEGVEADPARVGTVVFGTQRLRDRDEAAIRGYRDALQQVHTNAAGCAVSEQTISRFHSLCSGEIWDAGRYKEKDGDIIEKYPNGRERIRFKPVAASETARYMGELTAAWRDCLREQWVHPLVALAAFNLDLLCIHPFRDGNGRVSRLLLLLQSYHLGYEVGRYISLERVIEQNKDRYYETLEQSSRGWHEGRHDPWPYIGYLLFIFGTAYREFEERVGQVSSPRGSKTALVEAAIEALASDFTLNDLERTCAGVSRDLIRRVLRDLRKAQRIVCLGRGPGATWRKTEKG